MLNLCFYRDSKRSEANGPLENKMSFQLEMEGVCLRFYRSKRGSEDKIYTSLQYILKLGGNN